MMRRILQISAGVLTALTFRRLFRALRQDRKPIPEEALVTDGHLQQIDGVGVHYRWEGAGSPVVLVHGLLGSTQTWSAASTALSTNMKAISVDLPGSGLSGKPLDFDYSAQAQGAVLAKFIRDTCAEPAVLAVSSTGAPAALHAASASDGNVRLIVLLSPILGVNLPFDWNSLSGAFRTRMLELALSSRSLLRLAIGRLSGNSLSAANAAEAIYKEGRTPGYIAASDKNIDALFSRENSFQADSIQVPIRLVVGGQDPLASLLSHDTLITLATDVSVTVLPRCGHMIELQAPAQVSSLIERFIDELT